jgi:hypothetical protein
VLDMQQKRDVALCLGVHEEGVPATRVPSGFTSDSILGIGLFKNRLLDVQQKSIFSSEGYEGFLPSGSR